MNKVKAKSRHFLLFSTIMASSTALVFRKVGFVVGLLVGWLVGTRGVGSVGEEKKKKNRQRNQFLPIHFCCSMMDITDKKKGHPIRSTVTNRQ